LNGINLQMVHSNQNPQLEFVFTFTEPSDEEEKQSSNTYDVSYVDFNGKMITRTYDRHLDNKKE